MILMVTVLVVEMMMVTAIVMVVAVVVVVVVVVDTSAGIPHRASPSSTGFYCVLFALCISPSRFCIIGWIFPFRDSS